MTFEPENIPSFERIFQASQDRIRSFPGCRQLELYADLKNPSMRFTYSIWDSEEALETYRNSEFFQTVWGRTRKLFAARPKAWSLEKCLLG